MLSARDFVQVPADSLGSEIRRGVVLFEELRRQPPDELSRLTMEFLEVLTNPKETLAARTAAAGILWHSAPILKIRGSASVGIALFRVLEDEFSKSFDTAKLAENRFFLFRHLVLAIHSVDGQTSEKRLAKLAETLRGSRYGTWLTSFLETGQLS